MTKEEEAFLLKSRETTIERLHEQEILKGVGPAMKRQREEASTRVKRFQQQIGKHKIASKWHIKKQVVKN